MTWRNLKPHFKRKHPQEEVCARGLKRQGRYYVPGEEADVIYDASDEDIPEISSQIYPEYITQKNILDLLQELRSSLVDAKLKSKVDHIMKLLLLLPIGPVEENAPEPIENSSVRYTASIKSLSELQRYCGGILGIDEEANMLFCHMCRPTGKSGGFTYKEKDALEPNKGLLSKKFSNLKTNVMRHFWSKSHEKSILRMLEEESALIPNISGPAVTLTWLYHKPLDDMAYKTMVDIVCGPISCTVHRVLLARGSCYFLRLLHKNYRRRLHLDSINPREFEYILEYLYNGRVSVPQCHISAVMEAARTLLLSGLEVGAHIVDDGERFDVQSLVKMRKVSHKATSDTNKNTAKGMHHESIVKKNYETTPSIDVVEKSDQCDEGICEIKVELEDPFEVSESPQEGNRIVGYYHSKINTDISRKTQVGVEIIGRSDGHCQNVVNIKTENDRWLPDYTSMMNDDKELEMDFCPVKMGTEEIDEKPPEDIIMDDDNAKKAENPIKECDGSSSNPRCFQKPSPPYLGTTFPAGNPNIIMQRAEPHQNGALKHGNQNSSEIMLQEKITGQTRVYNYDKNPSKRLPPIRSIQELCNVFEDLVYDEKKGQMTCTLCDFMSNGSKGTFKYDAINGTNYVKMVRTGVEFKKFKTAVINHFQGRTHNKCSRAFYLRKGRGKLTSSYIYHVGYHLLKSSTRTKEFKELLSINERSGWSTGNAHDTLEILTDLRKAFSVEIVKRVHNFCQRTPCISWLSEIVSLPKYSHEIIAMVGIFPNAEEGNLFQSCIMAVPHFRTYDSVSLAEGWSDIASKMMINSSNISAIGTDDVHLKGYAASKFSNRIRDQETEELFNIPLVCDPDIFIDLAEEFLRQTNWIEDCDKSIARVSSEMVTESDNGILELCSLESTEWYHYPQMYYKRFLSNVGAYEARGVTNRTDETGPGLTYFIEYEQELCNKAAILYNFYNVLAEAKLVLRNLQTFPWEKLSAYSELINKFETLLQSSSNGSLDHTQWDFPEIIEGLSADEVALVIESIQMVLTKLKSPSEDHVLGEEESLCSNHILLEKQKYIRVLGDLEMARNCKSAVTHINLILEAFDELKKSKLIPGSLDLEKDVVDEAMTRLKSHKPGETTDNEELYKFLCTSDDPRIKPYINAVTRIWLIHPTGSFLKNMSDRLQQIEKLRVRASPEDLAHELIILWNGPPTTDCDHLVDIVGKKHPIRVSKNTSFSLKRLKTRTYPLKSLYQ